ncbi:uncharacterized protein EI90DRAFT_2976290 [Cantharellus anzutake]|uniref:uncharacterized protein n=1 Tax=Cantharellus anzutake TaxID=1750568 RepID=UPI0019053F5A|nr:uncharacterized protein EI90DRAFT_2976290 [Cantharellus anzutake]KAF8325878.1 hypothetical protein EI90DRAFT_2976290 [Cantharellus anzutake]
MSSLYEPVCRYFNTSRGCFRGDSCRYAHISPREPSNTSSSVNPSGTPLCRFFAAGNCIRGTSCFYKHESPAGSGSRAAPSNAASKDSESAPSTASKRVAEVEHPCIICYEEKPAQYGLLPGCSHPFCMECIRSWRAVSDKDLQTISSGVIKTCPVCRTPSSFVVPSDKFYPDNNPMKKITIDQYKKRLSKIPCKHIAKSLSLMREPFCPFGRDCFFQHLDANGEEITFEHGAEKMQAAQERRLTRMMREANYVRFQDALDSFADDLLSTNFETLMSRIGDGELDYGDEYDDDDEEDDWEDGENDDWEEEDNAMFRRLLDEQQQYLLSERFAELASVIY